MNKLKFLTLLCGLLLLTAFVRTREKATVSEVESILTGKVNVTDPPSMQMYNYIEMYSDSFNIPKRYAYGIANAETSYKGPFHFNYNPHQASCAGAVGPMQVMPSTARGLNKDNCTMDKLKNDIEYNVYTSMKLLRKLYDRYGDWKTVFGCYNTGRPCINGYAEKVYNYDFDWKTVEL
jgi:soluble lytic murein transglycosylase-like protein